MNPMQSDSAETAPAGWHHDPESHGRGRRYWDGHMWTQQFEHPPGGQAAPPPPAPPGQLSDAPMTVQQTVINVGSQKSVVGAVVLAFLFGPLGMLYATVLGAIVMFFVSLIVVIPTLGLGLIITIPIGMLWAGISASSHNSRLGGQASQIVQPASATSAAAGWQADPAGTGRLRYWDGARWTDHYSGGPAESNGAPAPASPGLGPSAVPAALPAATSSDTSSTVEIEGDSNEHDLATDDAVAAAEAQDSESQEPTDGQKAFCEECGAGRLADDRYCAACGASQPA